tara:strand:+ start:113 stop:220 length:108 start_codon:yes stop_codon:yes gene_type:complete
MYNILELAISVSIFLGTCILALVAIMYYGDWWDDE